jgi:hypothetical protein
MPTRQPTTDLQLKNAVHAMKDSQLKDYLSDRRSEAHQGSLLQHLLVSIAKADEEEWALVVVYSAGAAWASEVLPSLDVEADFDDVTRVLNAQWLSEDWGWTSFVEGANAIEVVHHRGPFVELMGEERLLYAAELMRGFYAAVLQHLSGDPGLDVVLDEQRSGLDQLVFVLGASR